MVGEDLRIGTKREEDAECVAEALGEYRPELEQGEGDWAVVIPAQSEGVLVTDLLTALEQCLTENEIRSVTVTIGEQSYVMEGMT
jgi:hypothetical protein